MGFMQLVVAGAGLALAASGAAAQCDPNAFEDYPPDTEITDQYPGVVFSGSQGQCQQGYPRPHIVEPNGGTVSGTQCLGIQTGCPDFSPEFLRMMFDVPQRLVQFAIGEQTGVAGYVMQVRAYNTSGVLISSSDYVTKTGCHQQVGVGGSGEPAVIKRVEVEVTTNQLFEVIDDLTFGSDTTPPTVEIDSPAYRACVCSGTMYIVGTVADDDGQYDCDTFSYRPVNPGPGEDWEDVRTSCGAFSGELHSWDTTDIDDGEYYLRLIGRNKCGLVASDTTVVRVDKRFDSLAITQPQEGAVVCGIIDIWGTAWDQCFDEYIVEYNAGQGYELLYTSSSRVSSCVLAEFDTRTVPDGICKIRVTGTDGCGNTRQESVVITVDNSEDFCECTPDINQDGKVDFADILLILANWG